MQKHRRRPLDRLLLERLEERLSPAVLSFRAGAADTFISALEPALLHGTATMLRVEANPIGPTEQTLLRFDQLFGSGPNQIPAGSTIHSASLSIWTGSGASTTAKIELHRMLQSWVPDGATWKSFGANGQAGIQFDGVEASANIDGEIDNVQNNGYRIIGGLAGAVQGWAGGGNHGWVLSAGAASSKWLMESADAATADHRPVLTVNFTTPDATPMPTYSQLAGEPPAATSLTWPSWQTTLESARLSRIPSARTSTYFFAANGNDVTGDGDINSPWRTLTKAQSVLDAAGGDVRLRFRRGDVWRDASILSVATPNITIDAYGDTLLPAPLFSRFTNDVAGDWAPVPGGSAWRRSEPEPVGWVRPANDPLGTTYYRAASALEVSHREHSWYYDHAAGVLYVNTGQLDPNTLPGGLQACPDDGAGWSVVADNVRLQDLQIHGSGVSASGETPGLTIDPGAGGEFAAINVSVAFAGSRGFAVSGSGAAITLISCSSGQLVNRGGTGAPGSGSVAPFDVDSGAGGSELILRDCVVTGGALPSADWNALAGQRHGRFGVFQHSVGPSFPPALSIALRTQYPDRPWQVEGGTLVWGPTVSSPSLARAYIVGESPVDGIDSQPGLGSADRVYVNNTYTHLANGRLVGSPAAVYDGGVYNGWAFNTTVRVDASQVSGSKGAIAWFRSAAPIGAQFENGRFDISGLDARNFEFLPADAPVAGFRIRNSILSATGSAPVSLGSALAPNRLDHNAYAFSSTIAGLTGVDAAAVVLTAPPEPLTIPAIGEPLFGAGGATTVEIDAEGRDRAVGRSDIGPLTGVTAMVSNRNKPYDQLAGVGSPPSPDDPAWYSWQQRLQDARLANVPSERNTTYYFAQSGDDLTGDGSMEHPFRSVAWANGLMSVRYAAANFGANALVAPDVPEFQPNGKDFSIAMWTDFLNTGNSKIAARDGSWSLGFVDSTHIGMTVTSAGGVATTAVWPAAFASGWQFLVAGYDAGENRVFISLGGEAPVTAIAPGPTAAGAGPLRFFSTSGTNYAPGILDDMAYWSSSPEQGGALSASQIAALYRDGIGRRFEEVPPDIRPGLVSWWNFDEYYGATVYRDKKQIADLTPMGVISPYEMVRPVPEGIRLRFRGGDLWRDDASINVGDRFVTIDSYGAGKAHFSRFSRTYAATWVQVGANLWRQPVSDSVGWVRPAANPLGDILKLEQNSLTTSLYPHSFSYDPNGTDPNSAGVPTVFLNPGVGVDPNLVPGGYESAPINNGWAVQADNVRIENIRVDGAGISPLGQAGSGYGLFVNHNQSIPMEFVGIGLEFYFTGYHAFGHISYAGSIATFIDCKGGLCTNRLGNGSTGSGDTVPFVSYATYGSQELIMTDCEVTGGTLPSWDWNAQPGMNHGSTGVYQHDGFGIYMPRLSIALRTRYPSNPWQVYGSTLIGGPTVSRLPDVRAYIVDERLQPGVSGLFGYGVNNVAFVNCSFNLPEYRNTVTASFFSGPSSLMSPWAINCTLSVDLSTWTGSGSGYSVISAFAGPVNAKFLNCRFDIFNLNIEQFEFLKSSPTTAGPEFLVQNCIINVSGTRPMSMGPVSSTSLRNNAYYFSTGAPANLRTLDPGAVILDAPAPDRPPSAASPLFGAGAPGTLRFDFDRRPRASGNPDIGPRAGAPLPPPTAVYLGAGRALLPLTPGQLLIARQPIDSVVAYFAGDVDIHLATLALIGEDGQRYSASTMEYNAGKQVVTWRLHTPFAAGRFRLNIDSTWIGDVRFASGILR